MLTRTVRDRGEIIMAILESAQGGQTQTRIMYRTMLNFSQLKEYLIFLQERNLILCDSVTRRYTPTSKGMEFIKKSTEIAKLINNS
jgi:predicted transcriptional regulator